MIHKCVDRPQGAQPFAERAVKNHAAYHNCQQNAEFPAEQLSQSSSYARVCKGKRNCALQYALRTQVLAEERIPHSQLIDDYRSLNEQGQEYIRQTMYMAKQTHKKMPDLSDLEKQA